MIGVGTLVVIALILAGGAYYYIYEQAANIKKFSHPVEGLRVNAPPNTPMDILVIGSDSRAFASNNPGVEAHIGNATTQTGQRSDVIIIFRFVPATDKVIMLSIPRDTWVPIYGTGGSQRINTAFNNGPTQLVKTITTDFHIPIDHVVEANFQGFTNIVNALGGVYLHFPNPVKDIETGLHVTRTGCQLINGVTALQLVRSRHLQYKSPPSSTVWQYDGMSDWSRIRRQQAFFHAVVNRAHQDFPNPIQMFRFVHATADDLTVDKGLSAGLILSLGWHYHNAGNSDLITMVLPTYGTYVGGAAVVMPSEPYASRVVKSFLGWGATHHPHHPGKKSSGGGGTTVPTTTTPSGSTVFDTPKSLPEPWNPYPC